MLDGTLALERYTEPEELAEFPQFSEFVELERNEFGHAEPHGIAHALVETEPLECVLEEYEEWPFELALPMEDESDVVRSIAVEAASRREVEFVEMPSRWARFKFKLLGK